MKILLLVVLAATASAGQIFARERATAPATAPAFSLLAAAKCDDEYDTRQCHVAAPKEWSAAERQLVADTMRRLTANELVRGLLVGAQENGYDGLRRYSTDTRHDPTYGRVPKFSPAFVLFRSKIIGITDAFFQTADMHDPISGYRFGDLIVIHELVHAYDDRNAALDLGFTSLTGWVFKNGRWVYGNPVSISGYNGVFAETLTLYGRGRHAEAWARDRSFATAMAFPLPTIQSLATPGESYADILAHLIVDNKAASYLNQDVVAWFETKVFPALREKARRFTAAEL
jgi:hypothetical protein